MTSAATEVDIDSLPEQVARAMTDLELARTDVEAIVAPGRDAHDLLASIDGDVECITSVSHWLQELATTLNVDLQQAMAEHA